MNANLIPDSKLQTGDELRGRLQDILRAQSKEQERSPHDRRGQARPDLLRKHMDKLHKLESRGDAIRTRLRAMGERLWH